MKVTVNWLKDYINTNLNVKQIADKLTLTGLEVDEIIEIGSNFEGIVVGHVLETKKHPNADKLTVCSVDIGSEIVQIVCGAPNVAPGQKVPVATVDSILPIKLEDGTFLKIKKSKIRGEVSLGMICAEDELGLGSDHTGIMVLDETLKPGVPFAEIVTPTKDYVIEIGLTPNRPDAACHCGTARDLYAVTGEPLHIPAADVDCTKVVENGHTTIDVVIENKELCHRYVGIILKGVSVVESPKWVQLRLKAIGLRPINAIVDATNYVLHELGQPLHAFDLSQIRGSRIIVKSFDQEKAFTTLDEIERKVPAGSLFICDGERPIALAGIMGGVNTEISDSTTDILIESAWFNPVSVRKTSRFLALQSDSSYRFERGVDPTITRKAAFRCASLIQEWAGGTIEYPVIDVHPVSYIAPEVTLRPARLNQILGTNIGIDTITTILERLGFSTKHIDGTLLCTVPGFRPDVTKEIDLIEEVARIYDYNNIPTTGRITFPRPPVLPYGETFISSVRSACVALRLQELYTNSLLPETMAPLFEEENNLIPTLNPISKDQAILRPTLSYGFLRSVSYNFNRKIKGLQTFEIGHVFSNGKGKWIYGVDEHKSLLIGVGGYKHTEYWNQNNIPYTFNDLTGIVMALLKKLRISDKITWSYKDHEVDLNYDNTFIGRIWEPQKTLLKKFEIEYPVFMAEFNLSTIQDITEKFNSLKYQQIPKFPPFEFDIAFELDKGLAAGEIMGYIKSLCGKRLETIGIFDVFEGNPLAENLKSLAFRLHFRDSEKTLTIQDIQPTVNKIIKGMESTYNAKLRS